MNVDWVVTVFELEISCRKTLIWVSTGRNRWNPENHTIYMKNCVGSTYSKMNKQTIIRGWHSLRLMMITSSGKRANYLRDHHIFHHIGNDCTIVERKVPLYPKLISLGDNVHLAAKVLLVPHDAIHLCLNNLEKSGGVRGTRRESVVSRLETMFSSGLIRPSCIT